MLTIGHSPLPRTRPRPRHCVRPRWSQPHLPTPRLTFSAPPPCRFSPPNRRASREEPGDGSRTYTSVTAPPLTAPPLTGAGGEPGVVQEILPAQVQRAEAGVALVAGHMRAQGAVPKVRGGPGAVSGPLYRPPTTLPSPPPDAPVPLLQAVGGGWLFLVLSIIPTQRCHPPPTPTRLSPSYRHLVSLC